MASMKSERQAYDRAIWMPGTIHIEMASIRLDRYYSFPSYMEIMYGKNYLIIRI